MHHVRRTSNWNLDDPGLGTTLLISNAKTPWKILADSVGSDIVSEVQLYPLNFRSLEEKGSQPNAPYANGYSTRYSKIINYRQIHKSLHPK